MAEAMQRSDYRPDAQAGVTQCEVKFYVGPDLMAEALAIIDVSAEHPHTQGFDLRPQNARDHVWVTITPSKPGPGPWQFSEVDLRVNGGTLFGARKPLVWYAGEVTDWASGLVRWEWPAQGSLRAVVAALTIRRSL